MADSVNDHANDTIHPEGTLHMADQVDIAYRMNNQARAKKVLKDLSRMLKEADVEAKLPRVKTAVAGIFGYGSWEELSASIGGHLTTGAEDHELEPTALAVRKAAQTSAIARLGMTEEKAAELLAKLRPTGRTGESVKMTPRVAVISTGLDYHPYRLHRAWGDLFEMIDGFEGGSYEAEDLLADWSERRRMHPLDAAVCRRGSSHNEYNIDMAFGVVDGSHIVIDASAVAAELAGREVSEDAVRGLPTSYEGDLYVHFGAHAFPSPYPHVGVEGAYLTLDGLSQHGAVPDAVDVKLVCSMPFQQMLDFEDMPLQDPVQNLRDHLRGPRITFYPAEGGSLRSALASFGEGEDEETEAWEEFVGAPAAAALNALKAVVSKEYPVADGVLEKLDPDVAARLERATTEQKLLSAVERFSDGQMIVRYLARPVPGADVQTEIAPGYSSSHLAEDEYLLEYLFDVEGYHGDEGPAVARAVIDRILDNTRDEPEAGFVRSECREFLIRTYLAAIAFDVGRDSYKDPEIQAARNEALTCIREALSDTSTYATMTMPLVWLAAYSLGFREEAETAWERAHGIAAYERNGVLETLKELADEEIAENGEDFAAVVEYFMRPTYEQTATGNLRPYWDKWCTAKDIMPRTPELEAWLAEASGSAPR